MNSNNKESSSILLQMQRDKKQKFTSKKEWEKYSWVTCEDKACLWHMSEVKKSSCWIQRCLIIQRNNWLESYYSATEAACQLPVAQRCCSHWAIQVKTSSPYSVVFKGCKIKAAEPRQRNCDESNSSYDTLSPLNWAPVAKGEKPLEQHTKQSLLNG